MHFWSWFKLLPPSTGQWLWPGQQRWGHPAGQVPQLFLCLLPLQDVGPECPTNPSTVPGWHLPWDSAASGVTGATCTHTSVCDAQRAGKGLCPPLLGKSVVKAAASQQLLQSHQPCTFQDCFVRKKEAEEKNPCLHPLSHPSVWYKLLPLVLLGSLTASFPAKFPGRVSALPLTVTVQCLFWGPGDERFICMINLFNFSGTAFQGCVLW